MTAFVTGSGEIMYSRGCFLGNREEFEAAIRSTHPDNKHGVLYTALIEVIELKLGDVSSKRTAKAA